MSGDLVVGYQKLPEWLLTRRVVPKAYSQLLAAVDAKVHEALQADVPEAAKQKIDQNRQAMNYFAAKEISEALKAGQASDPASEKWGEIVDAYNHKNLKWMSGARLLIQNLNYELPALKKHVAARERQVADCSKRQAELNSAEVAAKAKYADLLDSQGIKGTDPAVELPELATQELTRLHKQLEEELQKSGAAIADYYEAFVSHVRGEKSDAMLPLTRLFAQSGMDLRMERAIKEIPTLQAEKVDVDERLLESSSGREALGQEIAEVDGFLQARLAELQASSIADANLPEAAQRSLEEVQALCEVATRAADLLTGKASQRLQLLKSSQRYLEQQVRKIDIAKAQCSRPVALRESYERAKDEQAQEAKRAKAEAEQISATTLEIHKDMEADLSAYFKAKFRIVIDSSYT